MDKTELFTKKCKSLDVSVKKRPLKTNVVTNEAKLFRTKAAAISKTITLSSQRLKRLTSLIKNKNNSFEDNSAEVNELTGRIKYDSKILTADLDELESFLKFNQARVGAEEHAKSVVTQMKQQVVSEVQSFQHLLKERQNQMASDQQRKRTFGRTEISRFQAFTADNPDSIESSSNTYQDIELNLQPSQELLQQTDTEYLQSRVAAVTNIEKHIEDLGTIFSRFSELVAQSETQVSRIDDNVALAEERMLLGKEELLKYWNSQKGNFWLFAKISFVVLFFLTIFILFVL